MNDNASAMLRRTRDRKLPRSSDPLALFIGRIRTPWNGAGGKECPKNMRGEIRTAVCTSFVDERWADGRFRGWRWKQQATGGAYWIEPLTRSDLVLVRVPRPLGWDGALSPLRSRPAKTDRR